jgi:Carboxypeptidase regulatory-like domain
MRAKGAFITLAWLLAAVLAFVPVQNSNAQYLTGSIVGIITDQSGAVVPGAKVLVSNIHTGLTRQVTTDPGGHYRAVDLPEGTYTINVSATGFRPLTKTNVVVVIGQANEQDLRITVGAVKQTVTVQGSAAALQTETTDVHTEVSSPAVENLPLNTYQNYQSTELLAPGIQSSTEVTRSYPNAQIDTPDRSYEIESNGLSPHMNNTRVDGATDLFIWLPDHLLIVPPAETIQEVNVQTASLNIERAGTAAAAVDVVTKSGTNQLHGEFYEFNTFTGEDARNFFVYAPTPEYIINNPGFTLGGPIKKDKLFFFANFDGMFQRDQESDLDLTPPVNYRQGNFSSALSPSFEPGGGSEVYNANGIPIDVCTTEGTTVPLQVGMVFDPNTGNPTTGTGRCVFSSGGQLNVIPPSMLNQGAQRFWRYMPAPNENVPFTATTPNNYLALDHEEESRPIYDAKVDWDRTPAETIWVKYMLQIANYDEATDFGAIAGGTGDGAGHQRSQLATVGYTQTLGPNRVLTGDFGFERMAEEGLPPSYGVDYGQTILGVTGANEPTTNPDYSGMPYIDLPSFAGMGNTNTWEPYSRRDWAFTTSHDLTWMKGAHEFHMGFDATHFHLNEWQPEIVCCPAGGLYVSGNNTFLDLPANPASPSSADQAPTYIMQNGALTPVSLTSSLQNQVAEFDIGDLSEVEKGEMYIRMTNQEWQMDWYFGDNWKVRPKFTFDYGLQYYHFALPTRDGAISMESYNLATNTETLGRVAGNPTTLDFSQSDKLFAPHGGIAYQLPHDMVFRAGYGLQYDTIPLERPLRGFYPENIGLNDFAPSTPVSTYQVYDNFAQGIPLIQNPDISSGTISPPPGVTIATLAPGELKRAYVQSWNATIEKKLPGQTLLTVGYVGNNMIHQLNGANLNAAPLNGGSASQPGNKFGIDVPVYSYMGYLTDHYNSLQVSANKRMTHGLFLQGSYTWERPSTTKATKGGKTAWTTTARHRPPCRKVALR